MMARTTLNAARLSALALLFACEIMILQGSAAEKLYSKTFRSSGFKLGPGEVSNKYFKVEKPEGHVALRSFDAQVVDGDGTPIPLSETYLHHWVLQRYLFPKTLKGSSSVQQLEQDSAGVLVPNSGVCRRGNLALVQWFGLGSETRRTNTTVPPPYGIVVGDAESVSEGYEEIWMLNVHAIDTRGAMDVRGCTECVCELYNVTEDGYGRALPADYEGGLYCCHDETRCAVRPGFLGSKRMLYMEYTVRWVDMSDQVVPVRVYILDVTDGRTSIDDEDDCQVEYTVHKCPEGSSKCIHKKESVAFLPHGGDVIYAVAHQHSGGIGSTLRNEDGEEICTSFPIYGKGNEVANEAGYIVGMSTCYPEPGTVKVKSGEKLQLTSWYNNEERHTGVMGLFYLLVADPQSPPQADFHILNIILIAVAFIAALIFTVVMASRHLKTRRGGPEYQPIA